MRGTRGMIVALLAAAPLTAGAAGAGGFYIGVGVGSADVDDDSPTLAIDNDDTSIQAVLGYQLLAHVAIEGGVVDHGDFTGAATAASRAAAEIDGAVIGIRADYEVADHVYLQGRFGIFLWDVDTTLSFPGSSSPLSSDGEDLYYGIGGRWDFAKHWGASIDLTRYETDDFDVDVAGATLYWGFDF